MAIPYRTRRVVKHTLAILGVILLVALLVWLVWALWLGRFVVYSRDGARFDFDAPADNIAREGSWVLEETVMASLYYNQGDDLLEQKKELGQMVGYYVTTQELEKNLPQVREQAAKLEPGTPLMVDVKSIYGNFFYSSTVSADRNTDIDVLAMDAFLQELDKSGLYTIARLPAFRDFNYGLNHVQDGLPTAGGYLWMDSSRCYWLNPASQGTITYLEHIIAELRGLGFDEVVFYDFYFPVTDQIVFSGDKTEALTQAAERLTATYGSDNFTVSFVGGTDFPLPAAHSRLYVENAAAAEASTIALETGLENPSVYLVFLTDLHDTRFNDYSVLRPLSGAH